MSTTPPAAPAAPIPPFPFSKLSPAGQQAVKTKCIDGSFSVKALTKLLGELNRFDMATGVSLAAAKKLMTIGGIGLFLSIFGIVLTAIAGLWFIGVAAFLGFLMTLFVGWRKYNAAKGIDIPDDLRVSVRPVLRQLAQDLDPEKKVTVKMDLSGPCKAKAKGPKEIAPGRDRKRTLTLYDDPWCLIEIPLADGAEASLRFHNRYAELYRSYSTGRKTKSKTKWKKACTVSATLTPAAPVNWNHAPVFARLDQKREKLKFAQKGNVLAPRLSKSYKFKAADDAPNQSPPAADVLDLLFRIYSMRPTGA